MTACAGYCKSLQALRLRGGKQNQSDAPTRSGDRRLSTPKSTESSRQSRGTARGISMGPNLATATLPLQILSRIWRAAWLRPLKSHLISTPTTRRCASEIYDGRRTEALHLPSY